MAGMQMLVLERVVDEGIVVMAGKVRLRIVVTAVQGNKVKTGLDAPDDVRIWRDELLEDPKQGKLWR